MEIILPPNLLSLLKDKFLLLDTNVFIDALLHPVEFTKFLNEVKDANCTVVTIKPVLFEFLKGAQNHEKYEEKKIFVDNIVETYLPISQITLDRTEELIQNYKEEGKSLSITDFILGGVLFQYPNKVFLLTKNTNEFPTNIFKLISHFTLLYRKGIQSYGIYGSTVGF